MDTVTQIALGASVGEAVLGRKVGWRAPVWGGLCGLLPDLDVLWPFADPVAAFTWHRGYSHSFAVLILATPLIAWAATRVHPATRIHARGWLLLVFLALVTHPVLDCFTVYGTQVLLPFSDLPVGWSTIFIIDPVFSVPLIAGVACAQVGRERGGLGHRLSNAGLAIAVAWLAGTVAIKAHVDRVTEESLPQAGVTRWLTTPAPFNALLWRVVAMTGDGRYLEGYYSLLDAEPRVSFVSRRDGHELLEPLRGEAAGGATRLVLPGVLQRPGARQRRGRDLRPSDGFRGALRVLVRGGPPRGGGDRPRAGPPAAGPGLSARDVGRPRGPDPRPLRRAGLPPALLSGTGTDKPSAAGRGEAGRKGGEAAGGAARKR